MWVPWGVPLFVVRESSGGMEHLHKLDFLAGFRRGHYFYVDGDAIDIEDVDLGGVFFAIALNGGYTHASNFLEDAIQLYKRDAANYPYLWLRLERVTVTVTVKPPVPDECNYHPIEVRVDTLRETDSWCSPKMWSELGYRVDIWE
jgi:hypothetical protein